VVHFEEVEVMGTEGGGGEESKEGESKGEKMERDEKKIGVEKGKWGNRGLSELVLGQNGEGS
jgi:hypothetical protein